MGGSPFCWDRQKRAMIGTEYLGTHEGQRFTPFCDDIYCARPANRWEG
jgi:hypothetical protein